MKELPILFSGMMVLAILEGRKTKTRRIIKPQIDDAHTVRKTEFGWEFDAWPKHCTHIGNKYQEGDRLWVKETFGRCENCGGLNFAATVNGRRIMEGRVIGECSACDETVSIWKPSIFMPRRASRIDLDVVSIGVERLQQITEEDAIAEGAQSIPAVGDSPEKLTAVQEYRSIWTSINGSKSWDANPWVWVVTFKRQ